jgi:hypothetical protein
MQHAKKTEWQQAMKVTRTDNVDDLSTKPDMTIEKMHKVMLALSLCIRAREDEIIEEQHRKDVI